jgi:hypothetical protein
MLALVVIVLLVIYPTGHKRKPLWIHQSTVQPLHRSLAGCKAVYQNKLSSLSEGIDNFCICTSKGTLQMTVERNSWSITRKVTHTVQKSKQLVIRITVKRSTYWAIQMVASTLLALITEFTSYYVTLPSV